MSKKMSAPVDIYETTKLMYFFSKLSGISPFTLSTRNESNEKCQDFVLSRTYLVYSIVLFVTITVGQSHFIVFLMSENLLQHSNAERLQLGAVMCFVISLLSLYLVIVTTALVNHPKLFKIIRDLSTSESFVKEKKGYCALYYTIIAQHSVVFVTFVSRFFFEWIRSDCLLMMLSFSISCPICEVICIFVELQFLGFLSILHRNFIVLNSKFDGISSEISSKGISFFSSDLLTVATDEGFIKCNLHDFVELHKTLCDISELINSTYSLQMLISVGRIFSNFTVGFYLIISSVIDDTVELIQSYLSLVSNICLQALHLFILAHRCNSACVEVGDIIFFCHLHGLNSKD
jgi:hypothetical protein